MVGWPSATPPSEAAGMPLNLDLAPGKVNLLNYPELTEVCLLPSGGERLVFISGAALTNDRMPVASNGAEIYSVVIRRPEAQAPALLPPQAPGRIPPVGGGGTNPWCPSASRHVPPVLGLPPVCVWCPKSLLQVGHQSPDFGPPCSIQYHLNPSNFT